MARPRHPDKQIEQAVQYAIDLGWTWEISSGHPWAKLMCPEKSREGCTVFVYSTPRSGENHARHIRREVDICQHFQQDQGSALAEGEDRQDQ